jgi:hypothetical protein
MTEHPSLQELEAFAYDAADAARRELVRGHVDACSDCRQTVELEREEQKTLILAFKPEPVARLSFPSAAFETGGRKPPRETAARMLAATAAAVLLVSALWLALPDGGTPSSVKQSHADPEWRFPVELGRVPLATMGLRDVFRTAGGVIGVQFNQTLYYGRDNATGLKRLDRIMTDPFSNLLVEGESVRYLIMTQDGKVDLVTVEFADPAKVSTIDLGQPASKRPLLLELAARDEFRIALAEVLTDQGPGALLVRRSLDSGKTWDEWREVARGSQIRGQRGLLATSLGADVYYVSFSGTLACVRSENRGETWTVAPGIPSAPYTIAECLRVAATDRAIHLVFSAPRPGGGGYDLVHLSSADRGRTWSPPKPIAALAERWGIHLGVRDQYQLRMAGGTLFCSTGTMAGVPEEAQLYVSRDEGKNWRREETAFSNLRSRPQAALSCAGRQGILLALDVSLPEGAVDRLLLREYTTAAGPATPDPSPTWWLGK